MGETHERRAFCRQTVSKFEDALALYQQAANLDDAYATLRFRMGECLLALGKDRRRLTNSVARVIWIRCGFAAIPASMRSSGKRRRIFSPAEAAFCWRTPTMLWHSTASVESQVPNSFTNMSISTSTATISLL